MSASAEGAPNGRLAQIATLLDYANDLKRLPRTGWLLAGVNPVESVAEHSFATTLLALNLAQAVNVDPLAQGIAEPLDVDRILRIALVHDLAESVVTDLPKRASEVIGEDRKHLAEEAAWEVMGRADYDTASLRQFWLEYAEGETNEARLVRDADRLEMLHQALRYASTGNRTLAEFWAERVWAYPICGALRHLLMEKFGVIA